MDLVIMAYEITWLDRAVVVKLSELVSIHDLHDIYDAVSGDIRFDDLRKRIFNCLDLSKVDIHDSDIKIFAHLDNAASQSNSKMDTAIIATTSELVKNTEQYIQVCQPFLWKVRLFSTLNEAVEWSP